MLVLERRVVPFEENLLAVRRPLGMKNDTRWRRILEVERYLATVVRGVIPDAEIVQRCALRRRAEVADVHHLLVDGRPAESRARLGREVDDTRIPATGVVEG